MSYNNKNQIISRFLSTDPTGYSWDDENDWGDDPSQSSYDAGAASDEQAQENDEQRGGYDGGDGSASQITTPVSVFNPPKSIAPTVSALKEFDYTQMTMIDTSLSDSYFGGNIKGAMGDESKSSESGGFWGGVKSIFKGLVDGVPKAFSGGKKGVSDMLTNAPGYAKAPLGVAMAITTGPFAEALATTTVTYGYTHPDQVVIGTEIVVGALTPGSPNTASKYESLGFGLGNLFDYFYGE